MWDPTKPVAPRTIADFEAAASLLMVEQVVVPAWRAGLVDLDSVVVVKLKPCVQLDPPTYDNCDSGRRNFDVHCMDKNVLYIKKHGITAKVNSI